MRRIVTASLFSLAVAACTDDAGGPELLAGFEPPKPGAGEVQIVGPIVRDVAPGADITLCSYLPIEAAFADTVDVTGARGYESATGGHHGILYTAERQRPVDTHECTDDDMVNARFIAGAGGGDAGGAYAEIPEGVAYRIEGGRQLMIQTHWINTTESPLDGQAAFNLKVQPPSATVQLAQLFNWTSTDIDIPAHGTGTTRTDCVVQQDLHFYMVGGHAHEHGKHVTLTHTPAAGPANVFYDHVWQPHYTFDPPRIQMRVADAMVVRAGDTLSVDCAFDNPTSAALRFPSEMCVGFGFFFPADGQLDCIDGRWPTP